MLERYGGKVDKPNVCPGEASCSIYQSAAGKSPAAKERNACRGCELFETKRDRFKKSREGLSDLVDAAVAVQRFRDSGYPAPIDQISDLILQALFTLDECRDFQELKIRIEMKMAIMASCGLSYE